MKVVILLVYFAVLIGIGLYCISLEFALCLWAGLTPDFKIYSYICHFEYPFLNVMIYNYGFEP